MQQQTKIGKIFLCRIRRSGCKGIRVIIGENKHNTPIDTSIDRTHTHRKRYIMFTSDLSDWGIAAGVAHETL